MDFRDLHNFQEQLIKKGVPGCEIIVCQDHKVLYHEVMGIAHPSDRYYLYSCTKPITAVAAMICMEQNLFHLDDAVEKYLPVFADVVVNEENGLISPYVPITIRHLMTMSAGLDYDFESASLKKLEKSASTVQLAEALSRKPLSFQPGTQYQYSFCLDVLGAVIEVVTGNTLGKWCENTLFDPIGMKETYFYLAGQVDPNIAKQFRYIAADRSVREVQRTNDLVRYSNFYSGGAGVVSTATDYARFADTIACGATIDGYRPVSADSINAMRTTQRSMDGLNSSFTCTCGSDYGYGLGVRTRIQKADNSLGSLGEFGWDGAAGADILIDPDQKLSAVLLQHVLGWPGLLGSFHLEFRDMIYRSIVKHDRL